MKKLLSIILSITMLFSMATAAFADGVNGPMQKAKIKVGTSADFEPFEYYDENGQLTGFDIDLMNCIGEKIGFDIEFVNMSFDKLIPAVVNGEVACAISGITITKERESVIDYTMPYLVAQSEVDGEPQYEQYAIVFPDNFVQKAKLAEAAGKEFIYTLVNDALKELIDNGTVVKLIRQYGLNKATAETGYSYFATAESDGNNSSAVPTVPGVLDIPIDEETADYATSGSPLAPPSDWATADVDKAKALNLTTDDVIYRYRMSITREEFCELAYNYIVEFGKDLEVSNNHKFKDTDNEKIKALNSLGIIYGKSETEFAPNDLLTREEAATILNRLINVVHLDLASTELYFEFADSEQISDWSMSAIQRICNMGIMKGVGNNNFAPKDNYTTEQAIVTLVRVYANSGASKNIIGGADGPTSIIVGGNTTVIENENYDKFLTEIKDNSVEVSDFYVDEAIKLIEESGKLAADKDFISLYTTDDEMTSQMLELGAADYSKPSAIYHLSADKEQIIDNIKALAGEEVAEVDLEKLLNHKKLSFAVLPNLINASYGTQNLAALTILTNSRGYIMHKDFKNDFALYFEYDEGCSAFVTFSEFGDGVISANMSFVINGDKDNIFRRVFELTEGLGENSVKMALVK